MRSTFIRIIPTIFMVIFILNNSSTPLCNGMYPEQEALRMRYPGCEATLVREDTLCKTTFSGEDCLPSRLWIVKQTMKKCTCFSNVMTVRENNPSVSPHVIEMSKHCLPDHKFKI